MGESPLKKAVSFHRVLPPHVSDRDGESSLMASPSSESPAEIDMKQMEQATVGDDLSKGTGIKATREKRPTNSAQGIGQRDPSIILSYLKKNKYEDTGMHFLVYIFRFIKVQKSNFCML